MNNAFRKEGEMPKGHRPDRNRSAVVQSDPVDALRGLNTRETKRQVRESGRLLQKERVMESFMDLSGRGA